MTSVSDAQPAPMGGTDGDWEAHWAYYHAAYGEGYGVCHASLPPGRAIQEPALGTLAFGLLPPAALYGWASAHWQGFEMLPRPCHAVMAFKRLLERAQKCEGLRHVVAISAQGCNSTRVRGLLPPAVAAGDPPAACAGGRPRN